MWGIFDFGKKNKESKQKELVAEVESENSMIVEVSKTPEQIKREAEEAARVRHKVLEAKPDDFMSEMQESHNDFLKSVLGKK